MAPVTIVLCGEALRGDDGVGPAVAASLPASVTGTATVRLVPGLEPADLLDLPPNVAVIVVDAVSGIAPGDLVVLPLEELTTVALPARVLSSHRLPIDEVVGLASLLGRPPRGTFLGMGASRFAPGTGLSQPLLDALPRLLLLIESELVRLSAHPEVAR